MIKKILVPLVCLFLGTGINTYAQDGPKFQFEGGDTYDFGVVKRGPVAMHTFEFTNVGNRPINLMDVTPSCGCTKVDWIKTPVLPGKKGYITLGLKTEEQNGVFNKEVYLRSDAITPHGEKRYTLYIKGDARDNVPESKDQKEEKK